MSRADKQIAANKHNIQSIQSQPQSSHTCKTNPNPSYPPLIPQNHEEVISLRQPQNSRKERRSADFLPWWSKILQKLSFGVKGVGGAWTWRGEEMEENGGGWRECMKWGWSALIWQKISRGQGGYLALCWKKQRVWLVGGICGQYWAKPLHAVGDKWHHLPGEMWLNSWPHDPRHHVWGPTVSGPAI